MHLSGYRQLTCELPKEKKIQDIRLRISRIICSTGEQSEACLIPVPKEAVELTEKVEFAGGNLYLTKVDRKEDGVLYLSVRGEARSSDRRMLLVHGFEAGKMGDARALTTYGPGYLFPDMNDLPWEQSEMQGFEIPYEQGDEAVEIVFWNPAYVLEREYILPVIH